MIIIGLTDIHGHVSIIEKMGDILKEADVTLLVGDITNFGREAETGRVLDAVSRHTGEVLAVSGNCDYPEVDTRLDAGRVNLHGRCRVNNGIGFIGLGGSLVTPFRTPNEYTELEIEDYLEQGAAEMPSGLPIILVSHQPPLQSNCDRLVSGAHVGSRAVRSFIEKYRPAICFTGHIHESKGLDKIDDTHIINPGMLKNGTYAYSEIDGNEIKVDVRSVNP